MNQSISLIVTYSPDMAGQFQRCWLAVTAFDFTEAGRLREPHARGGAQTVAPHDARGDASVLLAQRHLVAGPTSVVWGNPRRSSAARRPPGRQRQGGHFVVLASTPG